ncbi:MAG: serine/threonine-protein kinase [Planctomycetota bacterium]|nr:serine/threonine-protein kinase [Planctomycetota bacterium]
MNNNTEPDPSRNFPEFPGHEVLSLLGEGGFGEVYHCRELEGLGREVAIKVIRLGMGTREILARFDAEMHALAKMNHEQVARVIGSGTTERERPYFIMEYIDGLTLVDWIDQYSPSLAVRLDVMQQICAGVQHAHSKGIIHRDLKPGNIIVTEHDGKPRAKVIDFGLAKALSDPLTDKTLMTGTHYVLGTWDYISPEQALSHGSDVDTRSDVYSLGGVLYRLLTGHPPHEGLRDHHETEIVRILRDDTPDRPSRRFKGQSDRYSSDASAALRTELDWIILKALEMDPDRRYASVLQFSEDIARFQHQQEPVLARPPEFAYLARKALQKHRLVFATVASIFITLLLGTAWALLERDHANKKSEELQRALSFQSEQLSSLDPQSMGFQIRQLLLEDFENSLPQTQLDVEEQSKSLELFRNSLGRIDFTGMSLKTLEEQYFSRTLRAIDQFEDKPLVQAQLLNTVAQILVGIGLYKAAEDPQSRSLEIRRELLGNDNALTLVSLNAMGSLLMKQGRLADARPLLIQALEGYKINFGADDPGTLSSISSMGILLQEEGQLGAAERLLKEARDGALRLLGPSHPLTLSAMNNMGHLLKAQGEYPEAESYYREALEQYRSLHGDDDPRTLNALGNVGKLLRTQGKFAAAEPFYKAAMEGKCRVLGEDHPSTLISINNMGFLLMNQWKLDEAEPFLKQSLDGFCKNLGKQHPTSLTAINNMGYLLQDRGKLEEAEVYFRQGLEISSHALGDDHICTLTAISSMGPVLQLQGKMDEAESFFRLALTAFRKAKGENHSDTLACISNMGLFMRDQGELEEAENYLRLALVGSRKNLEPENPGTLTILFNLGIVLVDQKKFAEAEPFFREAAEGRKKVYRPDHPMTLHAIRQLGSVLQALDQLPEAESCLREAAAGLSRTMGPDHADTLSAIKRLQSLLGTEELQQDHKKQP